MDKLEYCYLNIFSTSNEGELIDNVQLLIDKYNLENEFEVKADYVLMLLALLPASTKRILTKILFYPRYSYTFITKTLLKLENEKKIISFGDSKKKWYKVTSKGLDYIKEKLDILMLEDEYHEKIASGLIEEIDHNYYSSLRFMIDNMNLDTIKNNSYPFHKEIVSKLLALMLVSKYKFYYSMESSIDDNILGSYLSGLKTDLFMGIPELNKIFSIEVDTGTESITTLTNKIYRYSQSEYVFQAENPTRHQIIFVFEKRTDNTYHPTIGELDRLWNKLNERDLKQISEDISGQISMTASEKKALSYIIMISKLNQVIKQSNNPLNESLQIMGYTANLENLEEYFRYSVDAEYKDVMQGYLQYNFFKKRMLSLAHRYCYYSQTKKDELIRSDYYYILKGLNILCCPSTMFVETLDFDYDRINYLASLIGTYTDSASYPENIRIIDNEDIAEYDMFENNLSIKFDRSFYFDCDTDGEEFDRTEDIITFCEDISNNASGYIRMYAAIKDIKTDVNCTFLCIVNSYNDAIEFVDFIQEDKLLRRYDPDFSLYGTLLLFALRNELDEDKVFRVKNKNEIEYFEL